MKPTKVFTPVGIASYPHLTQPDNYQGVESYKCKLRLDGSDPEVIKLKAKLDKLAATALAEAIEESTETLNKLKENKSKAPTVVNKIKKAQDSLDSLEAGDFRMPLEEEYDDNGDLTGNLLLNTKSKASFFDKKTSTTVSLAPKFFDAGAKPMTSRPDIRGGSKLALGTSVISYNAGGDIGAGLSVRITAVQIIELAGSSAGGEGFGAQDGFDGSDYVAPEAEPVAADDESMDY